MSSPPEVPELSGEEIVPTAEMLADSAPSPPDEQNTTTESDSPQESDKKSSENEAGKDRFYGIFRNVSAIATIYLFLGGFLYRSYRNENLGLPQDNDASIPIYLSYAFSVVAYDQHLLSRRHDYAWAVVVTLVCCVGVIAFCRRDKRVAAWITRIRSRFGPSWDRRLTTAAALSLAFVLFLVVSVLASYAAGESALESRWQAYLLTKHDGEASHFDEIIFRTDSAKEYAGLQRANAAHELIIVERTKDFIYVLHQPDCCSGSKNELPQAVTFGVAVRDISYVYSSVSEMGTDFNMPTPSLSPRQAAKR